MHRSEEDSIEDFRDVYRFTDVFGDSEDLDIRE
jgi:hypothetical protein